jgi:hypothetical protein
MPGNSLTFECGCGTTLTHTPDGMGGEQSALVHCTDCDVRYAITVTMFGDAVTPRSDTVGDDASD